MLQNIRTVLVEMSHTGDMGSVAHIMKTIGLANLWLVNPLMKPDSQTITLTAEASDVVSNAHITDTPDEALAGCSPMVGTSACSHALPWSVLDPRECGLKSVAEATNTPVALVLGRERVGSTNEESQKCHYHIAIATSPEYSLLDLAMVVQAIAYGARMTWLAAQESGEQVEHGKTPYLLVNDLECFYSHLEQTLLATSFIRENHPGRVMSKLRRLFTRARPENQESNILHEILASIEQQNKGNGAE